jgi:selenocysteine lyase/cysteine desulfurase
VHRHAGLEGRDAGDADGPGRFRDFRGVGLFIGEGPVEPGLDRDGLRRRAAASAIRVSLGPETTEAEVRAFAEAWGAAHDRFRSRAA